MPYVKVVGDMLVHCFHSSFYFTMAIRNESRNDKPISKQELHTSFKSIKLHGSATSCLISLLKKINKIYNKVLQKFWNIPVIIIIIIINNINNNFYLSVMANIAVIVINH